MLVFYIWGLTTEGERLSVIVQIFRLTVSIVVISWGLFISGKGIMVIPWNFQSYHTTMFGNKGYGNNTRIVSRNEKK